MSTAEMKKNGALLLLFLPRRSLQSLRLALATVFLASCGGTGGMFGGERETDLWKVDIDAAAGWDGRTWATAFRHPQDAVDAACWGDEIWVAEGTYVRRSPPDAVVLRMKEGVSIYGGFAGTEDRRDERDWTTHVTTLDGETLVYRVVVGAPDAILNGFTVTRGSTGGYGGGMSTYGATNLTVANCTFSDNTARYGGGMYNRNSSPTVTNCTFLGNVAQEYGGGMYNHYYAYPTVTSCTFSGNWAHLDGGGMCNEWSSSPIVASCTFSGNTADRNGGGMCNTDDCSSQVMDCTFSGNTAEDGGGMYNNESSPTVTGCTFSGNTGDTGSSSGGGMCNSLSYLVVTDCTFSGNSVRDRGGGMHNGGGRRLSRIALSRATLPTGTGMAAGCGIRVPPF